MTYTALLPHIEKLAIGLYTLAGVREGNKVAIFSENSLPYALLVLATWRCGGVVVAINSLLMPGMCKHHHLLSPTPYK